MGVSFWKHAMVIAQFQSVKDLSMNHIKTMPPEMFLPCPKLTQIILRDNELTQVRWRLKLYRVKLKVYPLYDIGYILLLRRIPHGFEHFIISHDIDRILTWAEIHGAVNVAWYRSELGLIETNGFSILMDFKVKLMAFLKPVADTLLVMFF